MEQGNSDPFPETSGRNKDLEIDVNIILKGIPFSSDPISTEYVAHGNKKKLARRKKSIAVYKQNMDIKEVVLDEEDLIVRIAGLQRHAIIGWWIFPEGNDLDTSS